MAPERAYLIVGRPERAATGRRPQPRPHPVAGRTRPALTGPPRPRPSRGLPHRGGDDIPLVRRHRPGRHRVGTAGLRHWPARRRGYPAVRRRLIPVFVVHRARHAAGPTPAVGGPVLVRSASLLLVASTVLVSGWFAVSGAAAFAQMVRP